MKAVVAGAGIGGVTAALALLKAGWDVEVLERAPELGEVGAGLSVAPNALRALDALGVGEKIRAAATPSQAAYNLCLPSGEFLRRFDPAHDTPLSCFHRADLHGLLAAELPPDVVRTGCAVRDVTPDGEVVHDTGQVTADLVAGADGIHSAVREALWPGIAPRFRYTVWRGVTEPGVEDAVTLAAVGLEGYDRARLARTHGIARMARRKGAMALTPSRLGYALNRLGMRAPASVVRKQTEKLWAWTPPTVPAGA